MTFLGSFCSNWEIFRFSYLYNFLFCHTYIKQGVEKKSNKEVAIKISTAIVEKYIKRETDCLALADHANIVKFIAHERSREHGHLLVMELCDGCLNDRIQPTGLEYVEFIRLCKDLCSAIQYLRQINVVHRDIKPENILVANQSDGQIIYKLGDFGAARLLKTNETYISLHGTFEFSHPDIFARLYKEGLDNVRADTLFNATHELWSIGATLYVAATGQLPFNPVAGRDNFKCMYKMITEKKRNDISATELATSEIEWSSQLPAHALGNTNNKNVAAYLAGLLNVCFNFYNQKL